MATAQKRGFRFPWGGDAHTDEPPPEGDEAAPVDGAAPAARPGASDDELGEGPFGATAEPAPDVAAPAREPLHLDQVAWPQSDRGTVGPLAGAGPHRVATPPRSREPEDEMTESQPTEEPEPMPESMTASMAAPDAEAARSVEPVATVEAAAPEPPRVAAPVPATVAPAAPVASPRRANPLMAGLVRAMRDAARTARDETVSAVHADAEVRSEAIRSQSAVTVTELKKTADADIAAIKDWSRAELARVRTETDERIEARRTQLVAETAEAGEATESLIARLDAAIEAFEAEMTRFFDVLLAEEDPARLATLAERMPTAPDLDAFPTLAAEPTPAVEPDSIEPTPPVADPTTVPEATQADAAPPAEAEPEPAAEPVAAPAPAPEQDPRIGWLDHLDPDAAAAAEAEALAGLDGQTNLIVSGLSSVAGIAAFKGALMQLEGVSAVSVTAGSNGDVLFTVTHDGQTELRDAVRSLDAFEPHLIADDGDTLSVAAREPAA